MTQSIPLLLRIGLETLEIGDGCGGCFMEGLCEMGEGNPRTPGWEPRERDQWAQI